MTNDSELKKLNEAVVFIRLLRTLPLHVVLIIDFLTLHVFFRCSIRKVLPLLHSWFNSWSLDSYHT